MTTLHWLVADHAAALLGVVAWYGAAAASVLGRSRLTLTCLVVGTLLLASRAVTVGGLAAGGWWFVQEKVLLGMPVAVGTAVAALLVAGRALLRARPGSGDALPPAGVVALFAAGHAALVGLVVTFVVGYPLDWSVGLVALAAIGAATLLTRTIVTGAAEEDEPAAAGAGRAPVSRRRLISVAGGIAVAGAAGVGTSLAFVPPATVVTGGGPGRTARRLVPVADLRGPTSPAPGGRTVRRLLTAQTAEARLASGKDLDEAWTYNGRIPGPALVATKGDLIEVTLRNADIDDGVTLHWHGYDVPCGEDGAPGATQLAVAPGDEFVYRFRADQTGTYWYHTHQTSHVGVRKGLYGTLVVHPRERPGAPHADESLDLTLPLHTFDGMLFVGDRSGPTEHSAPAGTSVRLRLVNTDSEPRQLALAGVSYRVVAVDGRDLHQPGAVRDVRLRLPAGGRYDLAFTMPTTPVALVVDGDTDGRLLLRPDDADAPPDTDDVGSWPELDLLHYGTPTGVDLDPADADRRFTLVLDRGLAIVDGAPAYAHTVNGLGHPSIPDQLVAEGDVVRFTVVNRSLETHPWHLHGHPVLVLSRDGTRSSGSPLWLDTFDVRPGEVWEVAFRATNPGVWMNHCHNLPHAHQGMMLRLVYDGVAPVDDGRDHAH